MTGARKPFDVWDPEVVDGWIETHRDAVRTEHGSRAILDGLRDLHPDRAEEITAEIGPAPAPPRRRRRRPVPVSPPG